MNILEESFDEEAVEALGRLFEQFWILRDKEPIAYQRIREREQILKRYISDKFGLELTVHQNFAKLEKIPVEPESWMGIQTFQEQIDYAIFCCTLAFMEQKPIEEQFLLSDLAEGIEELYPGEFPLDWTNYQHRRSLVRALKEILRLCLMKTVDGNLDSYQQNIEEEVLYEVTVHSRYFMRSYPDDLMGFQTIEELADQEWKRQPDDLRRKRVYRKLMLTPCVHRESEIDLDFAYIRNFRHRLQEDFEKHTPFRLEVFKNVAMLTMAEPKKRYTLYPDTRGIMDVALHTMAVLRDDKENLGLSEVGVARISISRFDSYVRLTKKQYGHGWVKRHRDETPEETANAIISLWREWGMASLDNENGILLIFPVAARLTAYYPKDY